MPLRGDLLERGFHIAAFESPTRATVVDEAVSPVAHWG